MKTRYLYAAASLIALTAVTLWIQPASAKDSKTEENIVVTINGTTISQAEIDADIQKKLAGAEGKMPPEQLEQIKKTMQEKAVDYHVTKTLLNQECVKNKITASPEEVETALDEMRKSLPENVTFEDALKASGITLEFLKNDITFKLMVNKLFEANVKETPSPTDAELKEFYEQNKKSLEIPESVQARHVLIKSTKDEDEKARAEKRARAEKLQKQLAKDADFAKIAAENSDCPSKSQGGSLGSFERGRMVKEFEDAAFSQKVMEVGPVVETSFGFHIIQVQAHTPAGQKSFEEVKEQIKTHLEQQNKNAAVRDYIEKLKSKATIVYAKK
jgi:peptidyl-prolyl cis-trans isomerase C